MGAGGKMVVSTACARVGTGLAIFYSYHSWSIGKSKLDEE